MNISATQSNQQQEEGHIFIGILLLAWMLAITVLALNDAFISVPGETPTTILISFAATFSLFSISYIGIPAFKEYVLKLDMRFLIMLHSWRMLGMGFVMLYMFDQLPALFAYLAGFGDALTAIVAVFLAYALFRNKQGVSRNWIWRWNTFGLIDFIIAVSVGILTRSDALLAPASGVSSDLMTTFPFVIIPGFLVQIFALTHIIIYLQLKNNHRNEALIKLS